MSCDLYQQTTPTDIVTTTTLRRATSLSALPNAINYGRLPRPPSVRTLPSTTSPPPSVFRTGSIYDKSGRDDRAVLSVR